MADYIEREALSQAILDLPPKMDEQGYGWLGRRGVWQMVNDFPAADVRPVVLCRDCKHWELSKIEPSFHVCTYLRGVSFVRNAEDFCSRGEKREEQDGR